VPSPAHLDSLRGQMPVSQRFAYFDHAAVGPLPAAAASAIQRYAHEACHLGDANWMSWFQMVNQVRQLGAQLLHAKLDEVALVSNTTYGINLVAEGFPWNSGDNVLVPDNEFPSNVLAWRNLARRGVEFRSVPVPPDGTVDCDLLRPYIDSRTRIIALSWVGFVSGYRLDVGKIAELAHAHQCYLALDAIQGLGAFPLDVHQCGVDFLSADGHKWQLGPEGAGLFFIRQEHLDWMQPLGLGWNSLAAGSFDPSSQEIKRTAARYEGGAINMPGMLGYRGSLQTLCDVGADRADSPVSHAILNNVAHLSELLAQAGFTPHHPQRAAHRSGILGISWPAADAAGEPAYLAARKHCLAQDIVLSVRGGRLRASPHAYNSVEDLQRLVDALIAFRSREDSQLL
jgi:cysteine desulfurase / selenocysteine lyase